MQNCIVEILFNIEDRYLFEIEDWTKRSIEKS
jgi:hypothetical protein